MKQPFPNFVWISLEDCSPRFGCYGDPLRVTPNIDRLAAQGTVYRNAFSTAPVCSPSRTTIITGFPATAMGAHHMRTTYTSEECQLPTPYRAVPPPYVKCFTEDLRAQGYYCTNHGKTDYQFEAPLFAWDANGKPASLSEIHWRNRPDPSQPFFSVFNLEDTHESRMWPGRDRTLEPDLPSLPQADPAAVSVPPFLPDTLEVRTTLARHYDNIAHNDRLIGLLLDQLEEDGLAENTVVMLWSDHGEGLPRAKRFLHDSGIRIPLIIRNPSRFACGGVEEAPVSLIDLAPTVFACAGLPAPVHFMGRSLLDASDPSPYIFAQRDRLDGEYDKMRCVRSARFKYIRNYYPGLDRFGYMPYRSTHEAMQAIRLEQLKGNEAFDSASPPEELYDVLADPDELHNLAADPACRADLRELREVLDQWQLRHDPDLNTSETTLAERFFPGSQQPSTVAPILALYHAQALNGRLVAGACEAIGPVLLHPSCSTEGASVAYRLNGSPTWVPYRRILRFEEGFHRLEFRALRYGYTASEIVSLELKVIPPSE